MHYAEFNPLSSRWLVMRPDGSVIRGGLSAAAAAEMVETMNASKAA